MGRAVRSSAPCIAAFSAKSEQGAIDAIARGANCVLAERLDIRTISNDCGVPLAGVEPPAVRGDALGSAGRADDVSSRCALWRPVEHCIAYNFAGTEEDARRMAERGRRELGAIPGVMNIFTGRAVDDSARFRYVWLVRFAHRAVIESYRKHPVHVAFADSAFRPNAKDRRSIDFESM